MIRDMSRKPARGGKKSEKDLEEMSFGEKLAFLRASRGLNQQQVADEVSRELTLLLGREPITNRAVSKWERGDSLPDAQQFICLLRLYDVSDVQLVFRGVPSSGDPFAGLNKLGRERANEYVGMLSQSPHFSLRGEKPVRVRQIPLYDLPASAGTGVFLDGDSYTMIDAGDSVPESANFAVRISGDSMTPLFDDGQIVYVRQQQELRSGDIGIFVLAGEAFCKRFDSENGVRLVSLNPKYPPIAITEASDLRVVGKVVG